jgi:hypothetical protein
MPLQVVEEPLVVHLVAVGRHRVALVCPGDAALAGFAASTIVLELLLGGLRRLSQYRADWRGSRRRDARAPPQAGGRLTDCRAAPNHPSRGPSGSSMRSRFAARRRRSLSHSERTDWMPSVSTRSIVLTSSSLSPARRSRSRRRRNTTCRAYALAALGAPEVPPPGASACAKRSGQCAASFAAWRSILDCCRATSI